MFQAWRQRLREAEQAFGNGQLDEACRLLHQGNLHEFLPAKKLMAKVAARMVERGNARAQRGETSAGWSDLETANSLGAKADLISALRGQLSERAVGEVEAYIVAGDTEAALSRLDDLERRGVNGAEARVLRQVARKVAAARRCARRGKFADAASEAGAAVALGRDISSLGKLHEEFERNGEEFRRLSQNLHQALTSEDWNETLALADRMLALAPESEPARDARLRAWAAVGTDLADSTRRRRGVRETSLDAASTAQRACATAEQDSYHPSGRRFMLWVDGVGGYLVCQGDSVVLGQSAPASNVDVPILADLSRQQAEIRRDGEGYLIEPIRVTRVNGQTIVTVTPLVDGDDIELGESVLLRFRRPHALSASARLEVVSGHRTQPATDGVILMADSLVMGSGPTAHVVCPDWPEEVALYTSGEELWCRTKGTLEIDGRSHDGRGQLEGGSQVTGDDFSLSLESL